MTPTRGQKKRVLGYVEEWQRHFLIAEQWAVTVKFPNGESDGDTYAEIYVRYRYHEADIVVHPLFWTKSELFQERTIVHELAHIVIAHMKALLHRLIDEDQIVTGHHVRDVNESTTDWIANILWAAKRGSVPPVAEEK